MRLLTILPLLLSTISCTHTVNTPADLILTGRISLEVLRLSADDLRKLDEAMRKIPVQSDLELSENRSAKCNPQNCEIRIGATKATVNREFLNGFLALYAKAKNHSGEAVETEERVTARCRINGCSLSVILNEEPIKFKTEVTYNEDYSALILQALARGIFGSVLNR